ncbi:hypothetical protein [Chryseobacterium phocaeense]|uniref:hypothetical protein n=1 Tax=Chryseobacterium phocaeense TaxID=1816690 RepID=UPI0009BAAF55|nr:hypothetical protein [Chryseobacterium phocaeense]
MKKIILISCIILIVVLFNYPVFDSEGISYLIILACFITIIFTIAKIYFPNDNDSYESVEKEVDHLLQDNGIFEYTDDGFYIQQKNSTEFVKWKEIVSVYSFSAPILYRIRQTGLEIITDKKSYEFDHKQTPGIEKLAEELYNHLPQWELNNQANKVNNFGLEKTRLYVRENHSFDMDAKKC